ncbi:MAG: hypothetical protein ACRC5C_05575 [Bacilli bacterium]
MPECPNCQNSVPRDAVVCHMCFQFPLRKPNFALSFLRPELHNTYRTLMCVQNDDVALLQRYNDTANLTLLTHVAIQWDRPNCLAWLVQRLSREELGTFLFETTHHKQITHAQTLITTLEKHHALHTDVTCWQFTRDRHLFATELISVALEKDCMAFVQYLLQLETRLTYSLFDSFDLCIVLQRTLQDALLPFFTTHFFACTEEQQLYLLHKLLVSEQVDYAKTLAEQITHRSQFDAPHWQSAQFFNLLYPNYRLFDVVCFLLLNAHYRDAHELLGKRDSVRTLHPSLHIQTQIHFRTMQSGQRSDKYTMKARPILTKQEMKEKLKNHYLEHGLSYRTFITQSTPSPCKHCQNGLAPCPNCRDDGTIACYKCGGEGMKICHRCTKGRIETVCPDCTHGENTCDACTRPAKHYAEPIMCCFCQFEGCDICSHRGFYYAKEIITTPLQPGCVTKEVLDYDPLTQCYVHARSEINIACESCAGHGVTTCTRCDGAFEVTLPCPSCQGEYRKACICTNGRLPCRSKKCMKGMIVCKKCKGKSFVYHLETVEKFIADAPQLTQQFSFSIDGSTGKMAYTERMFTVCEPHFVFKCDAPFLTTYPFSQIPLWAEAVHERIHHTEREADLMEILIFFSAFPVVEIQFGDGGTLNCVMVNGAFATQAMTESTV